MWCIHIDVFWLILTHFDTSTYAHMNMLINDFWKLTSFDLLRIWIYTWIQDFCLSPLLWLVCPNSCWSLWFSLTVRKLFVSCQYMWRSSDGILGAEYALESHKLCPQMLPQMTLQGLMRGHKTLVEHPVWDFWRAASASPAQNLVNPAGVSRWKCPIFHH